MFARSFSTISLAVVVAFAAQLHAQPFVLPIGGTPYQDWTIVNYFDLDPDDGEMLDYAGGTYTLDGHKAIDFTLSSFPYMDAGVSVFAAADGTISAVHDGEFDRCSHLNPCGDNPNYVRINHGNGVETEYLHLKKDSILVAKDQVVTAGQPIGLVGSSGISTHPHLHFTVYQSGTEIETYLSEDSWWVDPLPYAGTVPGYLDHGIVDHAPTPAEFLDRPVDHDVFVQSESGGQSVYLWSHLHGILGTDSFEYIFRRSNGAVHAQFTSGAQEIHYGQWYVNVNLPPVPDLGIWEVEFLRNGALLVSDAFAVVSTPGDYNNDGVIGAADYVVWRNNQLSQQAYDAWRQHFASGAASVSIAVPEPATISMVALGILLVCGRWRTCASCEIRSERSRSG